MSRVTGRRIILALGAAAIGIWLVGTRIDLGADRTDLDARTIRIETPGSQCFIYLISSGFARLLDPVEPGRATLFENGQPIGPAESQHDDIRRLGHGRFSFWKASNLYFSSSDGTDPRDNRRRYELVVPRRVSLGFLAAGLAIWGAFLGGLGAARMAKHIQSVVSAGDLPVAAKGAAGILGIFLFALGSVLWCTVTIPPIWGWADSVVLMLFPINEFVITHYPALYPLFARTVDWGVTHLCAPHAPTVMPWGLGNLSDASLWTVVMLQQLFQAGAITYFACAVARTLGRRLCAVLPFYLVPAVALYSHSILTDGVWVSGLLLMIGAAYRIFASDRLVITDWVAYFGALLVGMLTRHTAFVFAFLLPAAMLHLFLADAPRRRRHLTWAVALTICSLATYFIDSAVNLAACELVDVGYRSTGGRVAVLQIIETDWMALPASERSEVERAVEARCSSPLVAGAVPVIFETRVGRGDTLAIWAAVNRYVQSQKESLVGRDPSVLTDDILNEVVKKYFRCWGPRYRAAVQRSLITYLRMLWPEQGCVYILGVGEYSLANYRTTYHQGFFDGVRATDPSGVARYQALKRSGFFQFIAWWTDGRLLCLLIPAAAAGMAFRVDRRRYCFCAMVLLNLGIYVVILSLLTWPAVERYLLPVEVIAPACLALLISDFRLRREA